MMIFVPKTIIKGIGNGPAKQYQYPNYVFKYYISKVEGGGGSRPSLISLMQGGEWGVQNLEKFADVILERSLTR